MSLTRRERIIMENEMTTDEKMELFDHTCLEYLLESAKDFIGNTYTNCPDGTKYDEDANHAPYLDEIYAMTGFLTDTQKALERHLGAPHKKTADILSRYRNSLYRKLDYSNLDSHLQNFVDAIDEELVKKPYVSKKTLYLIKKKKRQELQIKKEEIKAKIKELKIKSNAE